MISIIYSINSATLNASYSLSHSTTVCSNASSDLLILSLHPHKMTCILSLHQHTTSHLWSRNRFSPSPVIHLFCPQFTGKTHGMNMASGYWTIIKIVLIELSYKSQYGKSCFNRSKPLWNIHLMPCRYVTHRSKTLLRNYRIFISCFLLQIQIYRFSIWLKELRKWCIYAILKISSSLSICLSVCVKELWEMSWLTAVSELFSLLEFFSYTWVLDFLSYLLWWNAGLFDTLTQTLHCEGLQHDTWTNTCRHRKALQTSQTLLYTLPSKSLGCIQFFNVSDLIQ